MARRRITIWATREYVSNEKKKKEQIQELSLRFTQKFRVK